MDDAVQQLIGRIRVAHDEAREAVLRAQSVTAQAAEINSAARDARRLRWVSRYEQAFARHNELLAELENLLR